MSTRVASCSRGALMHLSIQLMKVKEGLGAWDIYMSILFCFTFSCTVQTCV
jgi:hypothetical protein